MERAFVEIHEADRTTLRLVLTEPLVIGRACEGLLLTDPQLSRRHVELRPRRAGCVELTELGSTNGTVVAGDSVTGSVQLVPGDSAHLGGVTIDVVEPPPGGDPERSAAPHVGGSAVDFRSTSIASVADAVLQSPRPLSDEHRHGTITIVFSDIEESTRRLSSAGDSAWFEILREHNGIVTDAVSLHGGSIVKSQGDGFMMTFPSARRAVQAARDVNDRLASDSGRSAGLRVRMGMHTGEVIVDDEGDLFGRHVNLAARIANCALGGEILVSALTHDILDTRGDLCFGEPRTVELKGLDGPVEIFPVLR